MYQNFTSNFEGPIFAPEKKVVLCETRVVQINVYIMHWLETTCQTLKKSICVMPCETFWNQLKNRLVWKHGVEEFPVLLPAI